MAKTTKKAETAAVKTEEVKTPAKKTAAKAEKPAAKKAAAPKAEKKPAAKKTTKAPTVKAIVEYQGVQVSMDDIVAAIQADWTGEAIKTLEVYVKPEDAAAYYVVNGSQGGAVTL